MAADRAGRGAWRVEQDCVEQRRLEIQDVRDANVGRQAKPVLRDGRPQRVPAHLVEELVITSEVTMLRDEFGHQRLREKKYLAGEIKVDEMVTHTMPIGEINHALDLMHEGKSIRSVVTF